MLNLNFVNGQTPALNARNMNAIVESINTMQTQLASPFNYKGVVAAVANLPASGNTINDTYYVTSETCLYSWNGTAWDVSSMSESEYANELSELKSTLELLKVSLTDGTVFDWGSIGTEAHPLGWGSGYYDRMTGDPASSLYYMRSLADDINFGEDVVLLSIQAPTGYTVAVYEYDADGTFVDATGNINPTTADPTPVVTVLNNPAHGYRFVVGRWPDRDVTDYLTEEFVSTIVLTSYKAKLQDKVDETAETVEKLDTLCVETDTLVWSDYGTAQAPYGWRTGYYNTTTGDFVPGTSYYICTAYAVLLKPGKAIMDCSAPDGYAISVSEYKPDGTHSATYGQINTTREDATQHVTVATKAGYGYRLSVGRFSDYSAGDHLTPEFLNTVVVALTTMAIGKKGFLPRTSEMEFFTVTTNVSVPKTGDSSDNQEGDEPHTVNAVVSLPASYQEDGEAVPLIMLCHGQSARVNLTERKWFGNSADFLRLLRGFTDAGYAVFDVGSTNPDNPDIAFADWGNLALMGAYIKAWEYVTVNYNVQHKIYIYSESMGTQAALNMQQWYPSLIIAAVNSAPKVNIARKLPLTTQIGGYAIGDSIRLRFGFTGDTFPADLIGFDHYAQIMMIGNKQVVLHQAPPIKVLAGTADDPNGALIEGRDFYTALRNSGNVIYYREIAGADHHQVCYLLPGETLQEVIDWFNRFRYGGG